MCGFCLEYHLVKINYAQKTGIQQHASKTCILKALRLIIAF